MRSLQILLTVAALTLFSSASSPDHIEFNFGNGLAFTGHDDDCTMHYSDAEYRRLVSRNATPGRDYYLENCPLNENWADCVRSNLSSGQARIWCTIGTRTSLVIDNQTLDIEKHATIQGPCFAICQAAGDLSHFCRGETPADTDCP